jgi:GT2 family glycosyltransferase
MNTNFLIILLNYNNSDDTIECVESLKNSCIEDRNILVVENCSSDSSYEKLLSKFPSVNVLKMDKNLGFTGGNNVGIKYAVENRYEYAILLNNDTIVDSKDTFRILINEMDKNPNATLGTGRIFYYPQKNRIWYDGGKLVRYRGTAIHFNGNLDLNRVKLVNVIREIDFISGCYMCIRLSDLEELGFLDEKIFIYMDDTEYSARAIKKKLKLIYIPEAVIYHKARGEGQRTPRMIYYSIKNRKLLIDKHFGITARIYFNMVLAYKRVKWFVSNKKYHDILVRAIRDYNKGYFGQAPDDIP